MKIYKTGEPCPCCGNPIPLTDPIALFCFSVAVAQLGLSARADLPAANERKETQDAK